MEEKRCGLVGLWCPYRVAGHRLGWRQMGPRDYRAEAKRMPTAFDLTKIKEKGGSICIFSSVISCFSQCSALLCSSLLCPSTDEAMSRAQPPSMLKLGWSNFVSSPQLEACLSFYTTYASPSHSQDSLQIFPWKNSQQF